jgi:diguanylate cyclase (GGDEF)-like protein
MNTVSVEKLAHLTSEKIQIFLRIILVLSIMLTLAYLDSGYLSIEGGMGITILDMFFAVLVMNGIYYLLLFKYPYAYQSLRISVVAVLDILASVYVMYLVGEISIYYTVLLLWYMIGYGLRYGQEIAYIVYATIVLSWLILINSSNFWIENPSFAYSWLITYSILPLYYFHIVSKLKVTLLKLHKEVESSNYQATHDPLTNLPNRTSFEKKLHELSEQNQQFALLFIDLDKFKNINDEYGHHIGDKVLEEFAHRMEDVLSYTARLGGDEFVSIVDYKREDLLREKIQEVLDVIATKCKSTNLILSASIGISLFPKDAKDMYNLKKYSDEAMYEAKKRGKNTFVFYRDMQKEG